MIRLTISPGYLLRAPAMRFATAARQAITSIVYSNEGRMIWNSGILALRLLAENGDFDGAIQWEKTCIDSGDIPEEQRRDCEKRLTLYEQHRPCRDEAESTATQLAASATEPGNNFSQVSRGGTLSLCRQPETTPHDRV